METKTYDQQTAKFIAVVVQNMPELSSRVLQAWIENPKGLKLVLASALCPTKKKKTFEKWLTIKVGTGFRNATDFYLAFQKRRIKIRDWAREILEHKEFVPLAEKKELDLVNVATFELGFTKGASTKEIYEKAKALGLELCPIEVGPQLVLQYKGRYNGEWVIIATTPVLLPDGKKEILSIKCEEGETVLCAHGGDPESWWNPEQQWAFVLPRK